MKRLFLLPLRYYIYLTALFGFILALLVISFFPKPAANPIAPITKSAQPISTNKKPISYADAVQLAFPSVVSIFTRKPSEKKAANITDNPFIFPPSKFQTSPTEKPELDLGSGVIVSSDGHILTNNHVIKNANSIEVMLNDGRFITAALIGHDPETDLAVLKVSASNLPVINFGHSDKARIGDVVLAIGNPYGVGQTVTSGIISALDRTQLGLSTFENFIQTDAPINPGNSGGALINTNGDLIAINTAIISPSGGSQGISFAIPIDSAKKVMEQLITHGSVIRGWIGVRAVGISAQRSQQVLGYVVKGLVIVGTVANGPAAKAGLIAGDIITQINNKDIHSVESALATITNLKPGDVALLNGLRNNQSFQFKVVATQRPKMSN